MALPIFQRTKQTQKVGGQWNRVIETKYRRYYVQKRPYNLRLGLDFYETFSNPFGTHDWMPADKHGYSSMDEAMRKAYSAFVEELGEKAENASNVITWRQSMDMFVKRATQLYSGFRDLRRGRVVQALKTWGADFRGISNKKWRQTSRDFGSAVLEVRYGWAPLVKDMYTSLDVIQRPPPKFRVQARRTERAQWGSKGFYEYSYTASSTCMYLADIRVSNPNLWIANQMGLVNPASWLWEAIPFSFVVDWFSNVGQVLAAMTDFAGLELIQPTTTKFTRATYVMMNPNDVGEFGHLWDKGDYVACTRTLGISTPPLRVRALAFSPGRGLNAVSLLTQFFKEATPRK